MKGTDHLLPIASSLYSLTPDYTLVLSRDTPAPVVSLGKFFEKVTNFFRKHLNVQVDEFHKRIPEYPDMTELVSLKVEGDVLFGQNVVLKVGNGQKGRTRKFRVT